MPLVAEKDHAKTGTGVWQPQHQSSEVEPYIRWQSYIGITVAFDALRDYLNISMSGCIKPDSCSSCRVTVLGSRTDCLPPQQNRSPRSSQLLYHEQCIAVLSQKLCAANLLQPMAVS